jgi:hypothetical protein
LPGLIDGGKFLKSHEYVADAFFEKNGFQVAALVAALHLLGTLVVTGARKDHKEKLGDTAAQSMALLRMCKRGYFFASHHLFQNWRAGIREYLVKRGLISCEDEYSRLFNFLTLNSINQKRIGLWSRGPRFPLVSFEENGWFIDFYGMYELFHNLYFGVRDNSHVRGILFEENLRNSLLERGVKLEQRNFKFLDQSKAEADAVFFKGKDLILVDCLSVWRPLDFEISRPKTVIHRNAEISNKIQYAKARGEKVARNLVGLNYDFSRASRVLTLVVTPFVEWLWNETDELWLSSGTPRVMQANEFLEWVGEDRADVKGS